MISHDELLRVMQLDGSTGKMYWRDSMGRAGAGDEVGTVDTRGYRMTVIQGKKYWMHRLVWFYAHGVWPVDEIDHINHCKSDNRPENLRDVSRSLNMHNRETPALGVKWHGKSCLWRAYANVNKKHISLGYHRDWFDAVCARKSWDARSGLRP